VTASAPLFAGETRDPYLLAVRAYVWGFPLVLATRLRQSFTLPTTPFAPRLPTSAGAPLNNLGHQQRLSDPALGGVAPNVDTLYSLAWLDLAAEPFVLEAPDFGPRYYTFQMAYGDTAADVSLGRRTHGPQLPPVLIRGPNDLTPTPPGMLDVASPTRYFMLGGRVLVDPSDPADAEAVHALQARIRLRPLTRYRAGETGPNPVPAERPLDDGVHALEPDMQPLGRLGNVLRDWIVPQQDRALVTSFGRIALTCERGFEPDTLSVSAQAAVARGLADAAELIERKSHDLGTTANGWTINYLGPRFGDDYLLRAAVAKDQIYVTVPEEALYPVTARDAGGRPLVGDGAYTLTFAPGALPPVDAFWSLTLYAREGGLVPNSIGRYAIGDRSAGLVRDRGGQLTIRIQHAPPADEARANWLPAPKGPFRLMLRLYVPGAEALARSWLPPPVEAVHAE
jgi:hypothetical protein